MSDTFTRDRFEWLERLAADSRLHSTAVRVALVISRYVNRDSGEAWPSIKTIAAASGTPERSVERAVSDLCKYGYLQKRRGGFGKSNRYVIAGDEAAESIPATGGGSDDTIPATDGGTDASIPAMDGGTDDAIPAMGGGSFPPPVADHSRHQWRTNPLIEPSTEPFEVDISPPTPSCAPTRKGGGKPKGQDPDFETFFAAYPRKASKGQARKAWAKAILIEPPERIIEAARRYAAQRQGEDPRFTKHPGTWLNAEAWHDEAPAPPHPAHSPLSFPGRSSAKERTAAAIQHMLASDEKDFQ